MEARMAARVVAVLALETRIAVLCDKENFAPTPPFWSRFQRGTKRKKKFHARFHEHECKILKKALHLLKRDFEELQESKRKIEQSKWKLEGSPKWFIAGQFEQIKLKLQEFNNCQRQLQEINRQLEEIEYQQQEFEFLFRIAYFSSLLEWLLMLDDAEDAHQDGGFGNLFLDGWWLEFWEIVLLVAGDVERNPGPRQITDEELAEVSDTPIEEDDLSLVFDALLPVSSKWSRLCCSLGLRASLLDTIKKNHPGDMEECLFEGLQQWVLKNYDTTKHGLPSWKRLVAAVDDSSGGQNHALALEIAEQHKQSDVSPPKKGSVSAPIPAAVCSDPKKSQPMSTAFANMYRAISRLLPRSVGADELEEFLRCFCHPRFPRQLCVDPRVYEGATSTKDILKKLCPEYINPAELFILEGIVETFGSRQCKKLLRDFQDEFY